MGIVWTEGGLDLKIVLYGMLDYSCLISPLCTCTVVRFLTHKHLLMSDRTNVVF